MEEILEIIGEVGEGIDGEVAEAAGEAEAEAIEEAAVEATENVNMLRRGIDALLRLNVPQILRSVTWFIAKNGAAAAVFYGVTVLLKKLSSSGGDKTIEQKLKKVKAIAQLISDVGNTFTKLAKWAKDNEDVTVDIGDGITVPLPDMISKYTKPMEKVSSFGN